MDAKYITTASGEPILLLGYNVYHGIVIHFL